MWLALTACDWREPAWIEAGEPAARGVSADGRAGIEGSPPLEERSREDRETDLLVALGAAEFEYGFACLSQVRQALDVDADRVQALRETLAQAGPGAGREGLVALWEEGRRDVGAVHERVRIDAFALSGGSYPVALPSAVHAGTNAVALPLPDLRLDALGLDPPPRFASPGGFLAANRALTGAAERLDAEMTRTDDAERLLEAALAEAATTIALVTRPCHGDIDVELAFARARAGVEATRRLEAAGVAIEARLVALAGILEGTDTDGPSGDVEALVVEVGEIAAAVALDGRPLATGAGSWSAVLPASIEAGGVVGATILLPDWTPRGLGITGLSLDTLEAAARAEEAVRAARTRLAAGRVDLSTTLEALETAVSTIRARCPGQ